MTDEFYTKHPERFKSIIQKYINSDDILLSHRVAMVRS